MTAVNTAWGPATLGLITNGSALTATALNDSDNAIAWMFNIPTDGTITDIGFLASAETGTSPAYNCGLVTVDTAGRPTTTPYGGSAITAYATTAAGWQWVTLDTAATANAGDWAAVYVYPGTTPPDGSNNISVVRNSISASYGVAMYYTTAWTVTSGSGAMAVKYDDNSIYGLALASSTVHLIVDSGMTPDEIGNKFTVPANMTCYGMSTAITTTGLGSTAALDVVLYSAADSVLASASIGDKDYIDDNGTINVFWDAVSLTANTVYRLTLKPTTTGDVYMQKWTFESTAALAVVPCGTTWQWTERTDAGAWTDDSVSVCPMSLYISDITFSTTSGGGGEYAYIG